MSLEGIPDISKLQPEEVGSGSWIFSTIEISAARMIQPLVHCHLSLLIPLEQSQLMSYITPTCGSLVAALSVAGISAVNMANSALFGRFVKRHFWDEGTSLERGGERHSNSPFAGELLEAKEVRKLHSNNLVIGSTKAIKAMPTLDPPTVVEALHLESLVESDS
ncbi:hypothetical protein TanjilG_27325 [Lupinus angustifolius]|uniref:Uncharacterized protein n=1 Tax=Lupinus angustifolius TaxID=3871 RepID=A0A1J7HHB6_LUPAN|nr:hypothetical protein TanjilG_27325 [Lupinus angustifolius]